VSSRFALTVHPGSYSIVRLGPRSKLPAWALGAGLQSVTRTASELSVVCRQERVPARARREDGFRCLEVDGPLPFDATGVLSSLAAPLARARIPILAISTFDTDLLFVRGPHLASAVRALERAGHRVAGGGVE
jgi:uncharacterized protein